MNQHCAAGVTSGPGQRKSRLLPWLLLVLLVLLGAAACTDLQVALRQVDRSVPIESCAGFRFASRELGEHNGVSPHTRAMDQGLRDALVAVLAERGYALLEDDSARPLLIVDYTVRETSGVNEKRLDSPSDYLGSWRVGGIDDGTGSMDHTVADAAFNKVLSVTVLLIPADSGRVAWEGSARRSLASDYPQGEWLHEVLLTMMRRTLAGLPARTKEAEKR